MQITPDLAVWLADGAGYALSASVGAAAIAGWRARADVAALSVALEGLVAAPPASAEDLTARLAPWCERREWIDALLAAVLSALSQDDFAAIPLTLQLSPVVQGVVLADHGGANASLCIVSADRLNSQSEHRLILESGYTLVLPLNDAGLAVERYRADADGQHIAFDGRQELVAGACIAIDNQRDQLRMLSARRDAVVLRFAVGTPGPGATIREFDVRDGACRRIGVADPVISRMLALIDVVRTSGGDAALPALEQVARHADYRLRWAAMRALVARDPARAAPLLSAMVADDPTPELRELARRTVALFSPHTLAVEAAEPCPAI